MKLLKQNKTFHIRRRIPMDLKEYFPNKIYIARSLHTTDALFAKKKGEILRRLEPMGIKEQRRIFPSHSSTDNL